ncbi:hypothetical protein HBB16_12700 [Pseudonocardia sp. MCCB 268]|nr:hypothetical protein [Pseudonocardia cytotoxica]
MSQASTPRRAGGSTTSTVSLRVVDPLPVDPYARSGRPVVRAHRPADRQHASRAGWSGIRFASVPAAI